MYMYMLYTGERSSNVEHLPLNMGQSSSIITCAKFLEEIRYVHVVYASYYTYYNAIYTHVYVAENFRGIYIIFTKPSYTFEG